MGLVEANLAKNIESLCAEMEKNPMSNADYAAKLAKILNDHILTADVTVKPGIVVSTPAGPGSTTSEGIGSLS